MIPGIKQRYNEYIQNENGELMTTFCLQNEFGINNTFFKHKNQDKFTFHNTRGHRSIIDCVLTNRNVPPTQILVVRCLTSTNVGSGHSLVMGKIKTTVKRLRSNNSIRHETKIKIEQLQEDSIRKLYVKRVGNQIAITTHDENVEEIREKIKHNILKAAREALGERKTSNKRKKKTHTLVLGRN